LVLDFTNPFSTILQSGTRREVGVGDGTLPPYVSRGWVGVGVAGAEMEKLCLGLCV